jgi:AcrR family transcriptional regulator
MAYRYLGDIDTAILRATIQVAGFSEPNRFSTQEIADLCHISEYVIFDHFKTKDNLLAQADRVITKDYYDAIEGALAKAHDSREFFYSLIDFLLLHPDNNRFALNYCRVFPGADKPCDYDFFKQNCLDLIHEVQSHCPDLLPEVDPFAAWCEFTRELVCYSQFLIDGKLPDTPENRDIFYRLLFEGFLSYVQCQVM